MKSQTSSLNKPGSVDSDESHSDLTELISRLQAEQMRSLPIFTEMSQEFREYVRALRQQKAAYSLLGIDRDPDEGDLPAIFSQDSLRDQQAKIIEQARAVALIGKILDSDIADSKRPHADSLTRYLLEAVHLYAEKGAEKARSDLDALVNIYAQDIKVPRYSLREAKMIANAQEKVIQSTQWVTAAEISEMVGFKSTNKSAGPAKWKASNKIFSVRFKSDELYPIYALDKSNGFNPVSGLKPILDEFAGFKDSWGAAYWFAGANGYLGGKLPQDLLQSQPALVLEAAKDELQGVTHG